MLRIRRHVLRDRGTRLGADGPGQGARSQAGRRRIHCVCRFVMPDAPERLRRAARPRTQVHPHRPDSQWSPVMKRVDHVKASREFIADEKHIGFHDKRLWTLRTLRDEAAHGIEEWEQLRSLASGIKEHTLTHLADYLEEFERNATNNGVIVHWAKDAEEHNRIVHEILESHRAKTLVKSKS